MLATPRQILDRSPIRGVNLVRVKTGVEARKGVQGDSRWYYVQGRDQSTGENLDTILWIPEDQEGVFEVEGSHWVITPRASSGPNYRKDPKVANLFVRSANELLTDALEEALGLALGPKRNPDWAQSHLDKWFRNSKTLLWVDPLKPTSLLLAHETIRTDVQDRKRQLDYRQRMPLQLGQGGDYPGKIDPLTTSSGGQAGLVYRLSKGAYVQDRRIQRGESIFSETMQACVLFPENTRPGRLLIMRSNFGTHEKLLAEEEPLVAHESYEGQLSGVHLTTAIMHWPDNFADCIVVSQSAAEKLTGR